MINLDLSVLIDRPAHDVFEFVANPLNIPKWQANVIEIKQNMPGPVNVGTTFTTIGEMLGRRIEGVMEITDLDPDSKFGFKINAGPMEVRAVVGLKTVGTGTQVALNAQGNPGGLFKIAEGVMAGQVKSMMETNLARMKSVLEKGA